jgi:hypothetical protein
MLRRCLALSLVLGSPASTASADEAPPPLAPVQSLAPLPAAPLPQAANPIHFTAAVRR